MSTEESDAKLYTLCSEIHAKIIVSFKDNSFNGRVWSGTLLFIVFKTLNTPHIYCIQFYWIALKSSPFIKCITSTASRLRITHKRDTAGLAVLIAL